MRGCSTLATRQRVESLSARVYARLAWRTSATEERRDGEDWYVSAHVGYIRVDDCDGGSEEEVEDERAREESLKAARSTHTHTSKHDSQGGGQGGGRASVCVRACARAYVCVCVCVYVSAWLRICVTAWCSLSLCGRECACVSVSVCLLCSPKLPDIEEEVEVSRNIERRLRSIRSAEVRLVHARWGQGRGLAGLGQRRRWRR